MTQQLDYLNEFPPCLKKVGETTFIKFYSKPQLIKLFSQYLKTDVLEEQYFKGWTADYVDENGVEYYEVNRASIILSENDVQSVWNKARLKQMAENSSTTDFSDKTIANIKPILNRLIGLNNHIQQVKNLRTEVIRTFIYLFVGHLIGIAISFADTFPHAAGGYLPYHLTWFSVYAGICLLVFVFAREIVQKNNKK